MKAIDYLSERPFNVIYIHYDSSTMEDILYEEEYPAHIPVKDDRVILNDLSYYVVDRAYNVAKNILILLLQTNNEYISTTKNKK